LWLFAISFVLPVCHKRQHENLAYEYYKIATDILRS
jgi:hypothetical protein